MSSCLPRDEALEKADSRDKMKKKKKPTLQAQEDILALVVTQHHCLTQPPTQTENCTTLVNKKDINGFVFTQTKIAV